MAYVNIRNYNFIIKVLKKMLRGARIFAHMLNKFHFHKLIVLYIEFKVVG